MKYLKINDNKGWYWNGDKYEEIDKINKDDLLSLLNSAEKDDFELEPYNESLLGNKAHQIIYENIYNKFESFLSDKDQFKKEVDELYKEAINEYSVETKDETEEGVEDEVAEEEPEWLTDIPMSDESEVKAEDLPF